MCVPGCQEHVFTSLSRRGLFRGLGVAAAAATLPAASATAQTASPIRAASRVVDLTHTLTPEFPTFFGRPGIQIKKTANFKPDGYNLTEWSVLEHSGTHIDAPIHFAETGPGPAELNPASLVVPIAVIDVVAKAGGNPDYQVMPDDILAWERANGRLPDGCCVAMNSGWGNFVGQPRFLGKDAAGGFHFPGFHIETTNLLLRERSVWGLAVDTLSLDHGPSKDFKTHYAWLPTGRWGLENVANLDLLPARGATLVVGAPKIRDATGGPSRLFALI